MSEQMTLGRAEHLARQGRGGRNVVTTLTEERDRLVQEIDRLRRARDDVRREVPAPAVDTPGRAVWQGGVEVLGGLVVIRGRTLAADQLDEAEQHGRAVLAAVARMRREFPDHSEEQVSA